MDDAQPMRHLTGPRQLRWLVRGLVVAAAAVLGAWTLIQLEPWLEKPSKIPSPAPVSVPAPQAQANAFPAAPAVAPPGTDAFQSDQPIPLVLTATSPGRNAKEGAASIGTRLDNTQTYAVGGILANGARLAEVHADHVILERGNIRASLYLGGIKPPVITGSARRVAQDTVASVGGKMSHGEEIKPPPPARFATAIRSQPVFENGRFIGIQLAPGLKPGPFGALGLKANDLFTAIDGMRVERPEQIEDLIGALGSGGPVAVTVERDGQVEHLNLQPAALDPPNAQGSVTSTADAAPGATG